MDADQVPEKSLQTCDICRPCSREVDRPQANMIIPQPLPLFSDTNLNSEIIFWKLPPSNNIYKHVKQCF